MANKKITAHERDYPNVDAMPDHIRRARVSELYRMAGYAGYAMGAELPDEQQPAIETAASQTTTVTPRRSRVAAMLTGGLRATA